MLLRFAEQGLHQGHRVNLAVGPRPQATLGRLRQLGLQRGDLVVTPQLEGQAHGLPLLAERLLACLFVGARGQQQQPPFQFNPVASAAQRVNPLAPEGQARLAQPPGPATGPVKDLGHQEAQG